MDVDLLVTHIKQGSIPLSEYLTSTELIVHVRPIPHHQPTLSDITTLSSLELVLPLELVQLLLSSSPGNDEQIKALIRIHLLGELGDFIHSRVLFKDRGQVMITKTLDLTHQRGKGKELVVQGMVGGKVWYRRWNGRLEVLFARRRGHGREIRRIPRWALAEFYNLPKITKFASNELDL